MFDNKHFSNGFRTFFAALNGMSEQDRELWWNTPSFNVTDCRSFDINNKRDNQRTAAMQVINWLPTWFAKTVGKTFVSNKHSLTMHNDSFVVRYQYQYSNDECGLLRTDVVLSYIVGADEMHLNYVEFVDVRINEEKGNTNNQIVSCFLEPKIKCIIGNDQCLCGEIEQVVVSGLEIAHEMFEKITQNFEIDHQSVLVETLEKKMAEYDE